MFLIFMIVLQASMEIRNRKFEICKFFSPVFNPFTQVIFISDLTFSRFWDEERH
jgi:hypothetical protein